MYIIRRKIITTNSNISMDPSKDGGFNGDSKVILIGSSKWGSLVHFSGLTVIQFKTLGFYK